MSENEIRISRRKGKMKRESLFSLYSKNLSFYMPESADQFLCPVCKNIITELDLEQDPVKISIAHIIPKSMHGRLTTLACAKCDKRIGGDFDRHLSIEKKLIDQLREEKGIHCRIKCGSETYGAMFGISNRSNDKIYIKPQGNVPFPIHASSVKTTIPP